MRSPADRLQHRCSVAEAHARPRGRARPRWRRHPRRRLARRRAPRAGRSGRTGTRRRPTTSSGRRPDPSIAAMTAEGMPPWFLVHHQRGGVGRRDDRQVRRADPARGRGVAPLHHVDRPGPASRPRLPAASRCAARCSPWRTRRSRRSPAGSAEGSCRPTRSDESSGRSSRAAGRRTRTCGSSRSTTRPDGASCSDEPGSPARASRRSGAGVVRDPRSVPSDADRRTPLRRRRRVVAVQPRPARARRRRRSTSSSRSTRCRRCSPGLPTTIVERVERRVRR